MKGENYEEAYKKYGKSGHNYSGYKIISLVVHILMRELKMKRFYNKTEGVKFMSIKNELSDLKHYCGKEYRNSGSKEKANSTMYRALACAWVFAIINIVPLILFNTILRYRANPTVLLIYTVVSVALILIGIGFWFLVTKDSR